jgi:hypothetical protein
MTSFLKIGGMLGDGMARQIKERRGGCIAL